MDTKSFSPFSGILRASLCLGLLILAIQAARVYGQQEGEEISLELTSARDVIPGQDFFVSLTLLQAPQAKPSVREVTGTLCFSDRLLEFMDTKLSAVGESAGGHVSHELHELEDSAGCKKLDLKITFDRPPGGGVIASLQFRVLLEVSTAQKTDLQGDFKIATVKDQALFRTVTGQVEIFSEPLPIFACFFYMH